jgi:hypothetical protein
LNNNYHHRLIFSSEDQADAAFDSVYDGIGGDNIKALYQEYNPDTGNTEQMFGTHQPVEQETMESLAEQTGATGYLANQQW